MRIRFILFFTSFIGVLFLLIAMNAVRQIENVASLVNSRMGLPIAQRAVAMIDGDAFERLAKTLDPHDPFYEETRKKLFRLKEETGCLYLYTMVPYTDSVHRFIIDGSGKPGEKIFSP
ncbi:MAG: hypothetical protein LBS53_11140, partial [Synergistaceae bacterium]|nr:hypothetical protein [Synergistaceae bacterium]